MRVKDGKWSKVFCYSSAYQVFKTASLVPFASQSRMLWTERPNCWPRAAEVNFPCGDHRGHVCAQGTGAGFHRAAAEPHGQACPNVHRTKENKLEPSLEHSAKALCQREIPKDYGLEPRMWGQRIKEVHLKLPEFPSPPIAVQCPQDWWGLSVEKMSG